MPSFRAKPRNQREAVRHSQREDDNLFEPRGCRRIAPRGSFGTAAPARDRLRMTEKKQQEEETGVATDYSPAVEFADEVRAFAIVESAENESKIGDGGRAFGLLQMHPATFKRYYGAQMRFAQTVGDTWTQGQIKACAAFLLAHSWRSAGQAERALIVQAWNLGETGVFVQGRRNADYLARWLAAYDQVKGA